MRVRTFGDRALLVELESIEVLGFFRRLDGHRLNGVIDLVPAAETVLVTFDPGVVSGEAVLRWLEEQGKNNDDAAPPARVAVTVDVDYSGPDLPDVAAQLGVTADEVVGLHTSSTWTAAFTGFAPGFAYLISGQWELNVPRRPQPRTRVPAGSVGLAAGFSGIYPRESPGGWQLIGRTDAALWDLSATPPALITPGATVRFRAL